MSDEATKRSLKTKDLMTYRRKNMSGSDNNAVVGLYETHYMAEAAVKELQKDRLRYEEAYEKGFYD
jgi:hypothetical protein